MNSTGTSCVPWCSHWKNACWPSVPVSPHSAGAVGPSTGAPSRVTRLPLLSSDQLLQVGGQARERVRVRHDDALRVARARARSTSRRAPSTTGRLRASGARREMRVHRARAGEQRGEARRCRARWRSAVRPPTTASSGRRPSPSIGRMSSSAHAERARGRDVGASRRRSARRGRPPAAPAASQARAAVALASVSCVVNVFDVDDEQRRRRIERRERRASGAPGRRSTTNATATGASRSCGLGSASQTRRGPRSEPPMPRLHDARASAGRSRRAAGRCAPPSASARIRARASRGSSAPTSWPSTSSGASAAPQRRVQRRARCSDRLTFSPANSAAIQCARFAPRRARAAQPARRASMPLLRAGRRASRPTRASGASTRAGSRANRSASASPRRRRELARSNRGRTTYTRRWRARRPM